MVLTTHLLHLVHSSGKLCDEVIDVIHEAKGKILQQSETVEQQSEMVEQQLETVKQP